MYYSTDFGLLASPPSPQGYVGGLGSGARVEKRVKTYPADHISSDTYVVLDLHVLFCVPLPCHHIPEGCNKSASLKMQT